MEDEQSLRRAIMRALKSFGYPVICEQTVESCLDACASHPGPIHLLVTDVVLPTSSGPVIAERLKASHPEMKVLFMSGYTDTTAYGGVPVGSREFLQKPFTPDALATRVREILDAR
jgi:DNA-binding NtrC family response regulator